MFPQVTIPIGRKCGCIDMPVNQQPLLVANGYQNLQQIANPLVGNMELLMSNGVNKALTNTLLNAIQLSRLPIANNVQLSSKTVPICQETAGVSVTPNVQAINLATLGIPNIANIGTLANIANVGALPNIANIGNLANFANVGGLANVANIGSLANVGLQFVPNTGNVPVRLRRNIQKNFGGLCNSAITYDSTLLGLY